MATSCRVHFLIISLLVVCLSTERILASDSCNGRCGWGVNQNYPCQCNSRCVDFGDCCTDYHPVCQGETCEGRCDAGYDSSRVCQCNSRCGEFGNCCSDYPAWCLESEDGSPPQICPTTKDISEQLWSSDVNGFTASDLVVDLQSQIPYSSNAQDESPLPLFTKVNSAKLSSGTYKPLRALFDNYNPVLGVVEKDTAETLEEQDAFLTAILGTRVMEVFLDYAKCRGWANNMAELRQRLVTAWFATYPRSGSGSIPDTSGFEHVIVGEYNTKGGIGGFHNWISVYESEKSDGLNYFGYVSKGSVLPNLLGAAFKWNDRIKPVASFLIGSSPELDLALFSLAFWNSPNGSTDISLGGQTTQIQTYAKGDHVATAYIRV